MNNTTLTFNSSKPLAGTQGSSLTVVIALTLANVLSILSGTLGNSLVIICVLINRSMRSTTNLFISSLAAADLIVTSTCMPLFYVYNVLTWPVWPFGKIGCRVLSYLVHMSVMASALSLLAISYDRLLSIFFPMKRLITVSRAKKMVAFIWFVSPLLLLPSLFHHDIHSEMGNDAKKVELCIESWSTIQDMHIYQMYRISCYFLFLLQISVVYFCIGYRLYTRQHPGEQTSQSRAKDLLNKRKIIKMLFLVVALFALCWLPYMINKLLNIFPPRKGYVPPNVFVFVGNFLGLLNSVANPLVYAVLNNNFRKAFKNTLQCNCKYELEERRRTASVVSKQTQRMRSESLVADRLRASSLSGSENPVTTVLALDRIRCLSFTSIEQEALVELTNFSNCSQQNRVGARRNPENRRVSFGGDNLLHSEENANKKVEKSENEPENVNQGLPHAFNEINRPRQDSGRYLSPINEKGCNNKSFEE
ncbi:unnamed protein product [Porites lobata]|uniref:G-protein coupled receptors family 1 profile domain-containing protein n=1 Tax=Porites lobata TaxID=104759 RepID=A0ABN8NT16_9CNID|nr:unnamed protein product [Porites lobata]